MKEIFMTDYIEGRRPLIEALRTEVPLQYILMADNVKRETSEPPVSAESCTMKDGRKFASFSRTSMESV